LAVVTLQDIPGFRDLEQRIRGFLHAKARIPEAVRLTVAQMRGSPFNISPEIEAAQTRRITGLIGGDSQDAIAFKNLDARGRASADMVKDRGLVVCPLGIQATWNGHRSSFL
jgi:hypothetical protein